MKLIDDILLEWSYRCPKGYPTIVDGKFVDREEVTILNEILVQNNQLPIPVPESTTRLSRPNTGTNDTSLKEGLVCLFYDILRDTSLASELAQLHILVSDKDAFSAIQPSDITNVTDKIKVIYDANKKYYGSGKSMPTNLDQYITYVLSSRQEMDTLTNAISAAASIHKDISDKGRIIRDVDFDTIRTHATKLIKEQYNIQLQPDNWCPGDVYLVVDGNAIENAKKADTVNIGNKSINAQFGKNTNIVAISLKEEKAQAGKATTFAQTVFTNTFNAGIDPDQQYGTSDNKSLAKLSAKIARFEDYYTGKKGGKRKQSFIDALTKDKKVHGSVNTILQAAGYPKIKGENLVQTYNSDQAFYNANKKHFDNVVDAIAKIKKQIGGDSNKKKIEQAFVNSRGNFLKNLAKYKVQVTAQDSNKLAKEVQDKNEESIRFLSMKTSAYELASLIVERWTDKNAKISPAYKKIQEVSNPFVALTAFAIAGAGVSPNFWKVIGSAKNLTGHADFFDAKAVVDIDTKTSKIALIDSPTQAGFYLSYTTLLGAKRYSTKLVFRFSGSEIRIEVQELKAM